MVENHENYVVLDMVRRVYPFRESTALGWFLLFGTTRNAASEKPSGDHKLR